MDDAEVFYAIAECFAPHNEAQWRALTRRGRWTDTVDGVRHLLQIGAMPGAVQLPAEGSHAQSPLQDFMSEREVNALFVPPTWQEAQAFAAKHFTGGLPASAPPIESLYRAPENATFAAKGIVTGLPGVYGGESARYMRDLIARMGLSLPPQFSDCPDHLSLELEILGRLIESGAQEDARTFLAERFSWLTRYRLRLLGLESSASAEFYIGLVDVLIGIQAHPACSVTA